MNIGLLEDNPAILEFMKTALEMVGHTIATHTYGQSLLNALFERYDAAPSSPITLPYELLIVDLNLPDEPSGLDVITTIYKRFTPDVLPIIVVSAAGIKQLDQIRGSFPMLSIIRKPFPLKTLLQTVSSLHAKETGVKQVLP